MMRSEEIESTWISKKCLNILNFTSRNSLGNLFNETFLNEDILSKHTYFKLHDPATHHDTTLGNREKANHNGK